MTMRDRPMHYILKDRVPVPEPDFVAFALWKGSAHEECVVKQEHLSSEIWVSTVFLGIDHNWSGKGPPLLFETMVQQRGRGGLCQRRCSTWEQAEEMHAETYREYRRHGEN